MDEKIADEFIAKTKPGLPILLLFLFLEIIFILSIIGVSIYKTPLFGIIIAFSIIMIIVVFIFMAGLKIVKPGEAVVLTLFGEYIGSIRKEGFYFVNPFANSVVSSGTESNAVTINPKDNTTVYKQPKTRISMKAITLNNGTQKINDLMGNPINIGIVVIWKVSNTYKAIFNVDNYQEFLSIQCDSALRNIVRQYPYDTDKEDVESLRGSSQEIGEKLKEEISDKVQVAGLEILEARITHLAYAQEIAAAMLQRQQAAALVEAKQLIVEGAVSMVEMALDNLNQKQVVILDEERKAQMVSNLLVVLCSGKDTQPIVNSGSIY